MNTGIIASRYATALLRFGDERDEAVVVLVEAKKLLGVLTELPELRKVLSDQVSVPSPKKASLLLTALGGQCSGTMSSFLSLVVRNGREGDLHFILRDYVDMYYKSRGIRFGTMTTAFEAPGELIEKTRTLVQDLYGGTFILDSKVDPSIIGGFILSMEDFRIDASVATQLRTLRGEFNQKNNRIV